jgi:hypothetical protein
MRSPVAKACRTYRRERSTATALLLAGALVLALGAAQAQAAPKGVVSFFGEAGTGAGQFSTPRGVAANESTGHLYVVDSLNNRIQEFDALGNFVRTWGRGVQDGTPAAQICAAPGPCRQGSTGVLGGEFNNPQGIAIDQSDGSVYVTEQNNLRVQKFDSDGNFLRAWGRDVVVGGVTTTEVCTVAANCKIGVAGPLGGEFATTFSGHVAVSPVDDNVVVADPGNRRVQEFDSSGAFVRAWGFDVIQPGKPGNTPVNEQQTVTVVATGGTFTLAFSGQTTAPVAFDATAAAVQTALEDLSNLAPGDVIVTGNAGGPWTVEFAGARADTDLAQMTGSAANLTGNAKSVTVRTAIQGSSVFEVCALAGDCKIAAASGSGAGQFALNQPTRVAVDSSGSVYTVESAGNFRVQKFNRSVTGNAVFAPTQASGTNANTAPSDIAVDLLNDNVLITKADNSTGVTERRVLEFNLAGSLVDTHAVGAGLPATNGLAVRGSTGRLYLPTSTNQRVWVLGEITPPSATIAPSTDVTATSATFHGTVNPNGGSLTTGYHFEYSDDGGLTWTSVPIPDVDAGNGTADVPVSEAVTGLEPNTDYQVRLVASRPFAGGSATSAVDTFTTAAAPPSVSGVGAREITHTTAVLSGQVDPNRSHTTHHFEYGTDTTYGSSTPVDSAGAGARKVPVSKTITGLQPDTEYHFRLVATSAAGVTEGADHTFTTDAEPPQPSGRAYEMVSPLDKNGGDIIRDDPDNGPLSYQTGASDSGDAVAYASRANFGDLDSGAALFNIPNYLARRAADGWTTEGITPPVDPSFPNGEIQAPKVPGLSLETLSSFGVSGATLTPDAQRLNGSHGLYMRRTGQPPDQRYTLISAPPDTLAPDTNTTQRALRFIWEASTPDGRHVLFNSTRRLLPGAPGDASASSPNAVYEWVDGTLRLASVLPPGMSLSTNPAPGVIAGGGTVDVRGGALHGDHVISDDGGRLFFTADTTQSTDLLFVREDGAATRIVSASERPGDPPVAPPTNAVFWAAKRTDGSVAFFTSTRPLSADAVMAPGQAMLYRWDATAPEGQRLSAISVDPLGEPGLLGPAAISDDAMSVYFVARGELAPGATRGAPNLYLWRQGEGVRYVVTLDPAGASTLGGVDSPLWLRTWQDIGGRGARVSADGERLLFASYAQLDPAYDTTEDSPEDCGDPEVAGERCRQIYLYDASNERVSCLTCVAGVPVDGDANLFGNSDDRRPPDRNGRPVEAPLGLPRNLVADGRRAFFETARPLVTADQNSAIDVYEWEDDDLDGEGELRLISSGRGATDSKFLDASASGRDVFFTSRDRLVGMDTDNQVDLYDARIGGGIPAQHPAPAPPPCEGEDCQGAHSGAPFLPGVGSGGASHGDVDPGARPTFSVARLSRRQQAQLASGRRVPLRVRVNRAGRVSLAARAKLGGRMRTVATASKIAREAGSLTLSVKLSRAAVRELARKGKLKVALAVRFAGVREPRTSSLSLRRTSGAGERRPR